MQTILSILSIPLFYDEPLLAVAADDAGRRFIGCAYGREQEPLFAFVQVDESTERAFLGGEIELLDVMSERASGLVLLSHGALDKGDQVGCNAVDALPADALPAAGFFLPKAGRAHPIAA